MEVRPRSGGHESLTRLVEFRSAARLQARNQTRPSPRACLARPGGLSGWALSTAPAIGTTLATSQRFCPAGDSRLGKAKAISAECSDRECHVARRSSHGLVSDCEHCGPPGESTQTSRPTRRSISAPERSLATPRRNRSDARVASRCRMTFLASRLNLSGAWRQRRL